MYGYVKKPTQNEYRYENGEPGVFFIIHFHFMFINETLLLYFDFFFLVMKPTLFAQKFKLWYT